MATPNPASQTEGTLVTLTASFTASQIEWLSDQVDRDDVSVDRLVRQFVDAARGGGTSTGSSWTSATSASDSEGAGTTLGRLRKAKGKLDLLLASDEEESDQAVDETASPIESPPSGKTEATGASSDDGGAAPSGNGSPSMFDFVCGNSENWRAEVDLPSNRRLHYPCRVALWAFCLLRRVADRRSLRERPCWGGDSRRTGLKLLSPEA